MGYQTKVQHIKRDIGSDQWYVNLPTALAQAMDFKKSESVQWTIADKKHLILSRQHVPKNPVDIRKKRRRGRAKPRSPRRG